MTISNPLKWIFTLSILTLSSLSLAAQADSTTLQTPQHREYTEAHPLVYEDVWDLWPYAYLNDNGEPEGYNIDLIRLMMDELDIPYVIRLRPAEEAFHDLKSGRSDLMLGLAVGFHDEYGSYSKHAVTLFTQSVVTPKSKPIEIKAFRDLGKPGVSVIVSDSSLCHHLMIDYGWQANARPVKDIREVIQLVSAREEGQIVYNTLTLKWLMRRYLIDNLELTPVNMPHGEYKFMSNDQHLLDLLDDELTNLNINEKIKPLQDKWFYPDRQHPGMSPWIVYALIAAGLLLLIALVYLISYRVQSFRLARLNSKRNRRLSLVLQTSQVHMWTYDIQANQFAWRNENGQIAYIYSTSDFAKRYRPEDFLLLKNALDELAASKPEGNGHEQEITINLKAKDTELDQEWRDYIIVLSVLSRDKNGHATQIIGTKKDVTHDRDQQRLDEERTLRYWSIFYTPVIGIMLFDKDGRLVNINPKACEIFQCEEDEIIAERPHLSDLIDIGSLSLEETDGYYASQLHTNSAPHTDPTDPTSSSHPCIKSIHRTDNLCIEYRLMTVHDDTGALFGIFAVLRDITDSVFGIEQHSTEQHQLDAVQSVLQQYNAHIDKVLHESDVRLATYSPDTHTLTIHRSVGEVQHTMTQTRCMTLVDDTSKNLAMRMLNLMDAHEDKGVKAAILTTLRPLRALTSPRPEQLAIEFCLMPIHDQNGNVVEYLGLLRDRSELRDVSRQLDIQTAKVQEVENTKNRFMKNMVQEIRTPMSTVVSYVEQFNPDAATPNEPELTSSILKNSDYLLHLIDNILYLSRLQARMVEIVKRPLNFAELFESQCNEGWARYQNADTRYIVESPYDQLVVDLDAENLGHAIGQLAANAAKFTMSGVVRARYDYIGRRLIVSIDDTGEGMPAHILKRINDKESMAASPDAKGLGLAITKELVTQMGGTIEASSELGSGTTVYIMLPCHASLIKRKKLI